MFIATADEVGKVEGVLDASAPTAVTAPAMAAPGEATASAKSANVAPETPGKKPPTLLRPGDSIGTASK